MSNEIMKKYTAEQLDAMSIWDRCKIAETVYIGYPRFETMVDKIAFCHEYSKISADPECLLVTGPTGAGKSTLFAQYSRKYPKIVTENSTIVPVIHVTIPSPATHKNMIQKMLAALGDPCARAGTTADHTLRLIKFLRDCKVELIILDEMQHLLINQKSLVAIANWLKTLLVDTRIPIILFGLPEAELVIDADEQLSRRFAHRHALAPFKFNNAANIEEFISFLYAAELQLPLKEKSNLWKMDIAYRIHYATDGVAGYVMKLLRRGTHLAIMKGMESLDLDVLADAFNLHIQKDKPGKANPFQFETFTELEANSLTRKVDRPSTSDLNGISRRLGTRKKRQTPLKGVC